MLLPPIRRSLLALAVVVSLAAWPRAAHAEQVVITEIMHSPPRQLPAWVEVWNQTATPFDIARWRLTGNIDFTFPEFTATNAADSFLRAFERIVISSATPEATRAAYTNLPANVRVFGPWVGHLVPTGDRITLQDKNGVVVCRVRYGDRGPWSSAANGAGHTLVLRDSNRKVDDARNWTVSAQPLGTPGFDPRLSAEAAVRRPDPVAAPAGARLMDFADSWRHWSRAEPVPANWFAPNFDDSAWPQGPGLLGFGGAPLPGPGLRTRLPAGQITYYFRRAFVFNGDPAKVAVVLDQVLEDGAVYYLNGKEVARPGMPAGPITRDTLAERGVSTAEEELAAFTLPAGALVRGTNVFAAEVHQVGPQSSDITFGLRLTATTAAAAPVSADVPVWTGLVGPVRLNEVQFAAQGTRLDWVELFNAGPVAPNLDRLFLASRADFSDRVPLGGTLAPGACRSWPVPFAVRNREVTLFIVDDTGMVRDAWLFETPRKGLNLQASPHGAKEWFASDQPSRDRTNSPARNTDIVISEIMFDPPYPHRKLGFIELFNRGRAVVDVGGWAITGGAYYELPRGWKIRPGEFLVVAEDASLLRQTHGNVDVTGNWSGKLAHGGDLVRLVDERGNLVCQVDYQVGGDWPELTRGAGSSLELIHPLLDGSLPSAWRASDESAKSEWRTYSCTGTNLQLRAEGAPTDFKELHFHLVGDSHIALRNIQLLLNGEGTNLLVNVHRLATNGSSAAGWLAQGNHWASYFTNGELHLVADGHGDNRPNRAELDCVAIEKGRRYEVRFEARWISGTPRLIAQTWDHSIGDSFLIPPPAALGTPGRKNSRWLSAPPPQVDTLRHSPAVPKSKDTVKVTVKVTTARPLPPGAVKLFHRPDSDAGNKPWQSRDMSDDGLNGDEFAGDGVFTALLPEYHAQGQVVQFYVEAAGADGVRTSIPRRGADWPALFVMDDRNVRRDLRVARYVMSAFDYGAIGNGNSPKYGFLFPRLSNHYFNCTFIHDERDITYGAEIRTAGSPWTRGGDLSRSKVKLPHESAFRAHTKLTYDNDAEGGNRYHNRLTRYWLYLLGESVNENEFVHYLINTSGPMLREEVEPVGNDLLDRIWPRGHYGDLYRIDDEWWFTDAWGQSAQDANWVYKGTDSPSRYRTEWMKRSNEAQDDFTALIQLFKLFSDGKTSRLQLEAMLDPYALAKAIVARGYIGDWDTFVMHRGKNAYLYRRPTDGRFQFLHWDSDLGFDVNGSFWGGRVEFWLNKPWNRRLWAAYLVELLEHYTKNSARLDAWFQAEEDASNSFNVDANAYRNFCAAREIKAREALGPNARLEFKITAVNGATVSTNEPITTVEQSLTVTGTAPYGVLHVFEEHRPAQRAEWTSDAAWKLAGLPLALGENTFTFVGVDQAGRVRKKSKLTVVRKPGSTGGK
ncbi:MAG: lamin tail domain-containing protein [Limisphaerales bacterium]